MAGDGLRPIGTTGLRTRPLALGTMMLGAWGNRDVDDCVRIVHHALDAGINLVDTADVYADGESESIVGRALEGRRDDVVLATKVHGPMGDDPAHRGSSRRWIMRACEDSLRRLRTDRIDLYQLHHPDPDTDIDETLGALSDLVRQGKVRWVGTSNFQAEEVVELLWAADRHGHVQVRTEQPPYSIFVRGPEVALLPTCRRHCIGVLAYSPLNGGWLTGRHRRGGPAIATGRTAHYPERFDVTLPQNARKLDALEALASIAGDAGLSVLHLALGFVAAHPAVCAALIGPRTLEQLEEQLGALEVRLSAEVLDAIDRVVPPGTTIDWVDAGYRSAPAAVAWHERLVSRA